MAASLHIKWRADEPTKGVVAAFFVISFLVIGDDNVELSGGAVERLRSCTHQGVVSRDICVVAHLGANTSS
jgi:hypothetical protein